MRIPEPQRPGRPEHPERPDHPSQPGRPARRTPMTRAQWARLEAILGSDTHSTDVVVRFDADPAPQVLASLGTEARSLVEQLSAHRPELARAIATDRQFAGRLAADPAAALAEIGVTPSTAPRPGPVGGRRGAGFDRLDGLRFELPATALPAEPTGQAASPGVAAGLLAQTIRTALQTSDGWSTLRTDPPAAVTAAARTFPWSAAGIQPDSPVAASLVQQVAAALADALQWTGSSSGSSSGGPGADVGDFVERPPLVDLEVRAGRVRSVRIPSTRAER